MAIAVEMPKMSDTMEEGVLAAWLVDEGTSVSAGDVVAQVETDKATMDLEVYDDGVLLKRVIGEGDAVPIGGLIAILGQEGEDVSDILAKYGAGGDGASAEPTPAPAAAPAPAAPANPAAPASAPAASATPAAPGGRVKASPLARTMATEQGIDLEAIAGSGPEGRIIRRDVEAAMGGTAQPVVQPAAPVATPRPVVEPSASVAAPDGAYESVRISQMRKTIARRLAESKFTNPHFYLTADIDMSEAVSFRAKLNEKAEARDLGKVSFNDLVTKACALALRQHPWVNASWMEAEGEIRLHKDVHMAIAVSVEEGLITPVIRHADRKGLTELASETRDLATKARNRELQPEDWSGSTFSTSNLGMFGIDEFTAIINPPNACILAIGSIRDVPVVKDGVVVPGKQMKVTLSCDHRVVDGVAGAEFLKTVRGYLEDPVTMLL
ncbi:MAG: pyruvate dehydrogenase complex dihydrolipoamide acetyltransferase [Bacteroidetes bacterium]|nr:pyruvate dehydrogenase complex dihydrolipoamide acetyltransferase [Bacteroidota bacterium]